MVSSEKRMLSLQSLRDIQVEIPRGQVKGVGAGVGSCESSVHGPGTDYPGEVTD